MAENNQHFNIQELADKWAQGKLTPDERAYLERWYADFNDEHINMTDSRHDNAEALRNAMFRHISNQIQPNVKPVRTLLHWPRVAAAASILLFISIGGYFLLHKKQASQQIAQNKIHDIAPGGNKATLTLSNGQKIILSDAHNGTIASQGRTLVKKTEAGQVVYEASPSTSGANEVMAFNTIATPRGGQWPEVVLPDGSKVMLDAASSIKYPVHFSGRERVVEVTGQVYFEVAHDNVHPFKVTVKGQAIEDLGTHFNVNAYDDEPVIRVTLEQGRVRIVKGQKSALLVPGQQAITNAGSDFIQVKDANVDEVIAWKNGQTSFNDLDIQAIMRQVSRWYDVDIEFQGNIPERSFTGGISRKSNLSSLLKILELNNIHFTVEGKKITVKQ